MAYLFTFIYYNILKLYNSSTVGKVGDEYVVKLVIKASML